MALNGYNKLVTAKSDIETKYGSKELRKPVISVDWNLNESFDATSSVKIPKATAVDGNNQSVFVESQVLFNGKVVKQDSDGYITANESGVYTVVYTATNFYGESVSKEFTFTVNAPKADLTLVMLIGGVAITLVAISLVVVFLKTKPTKNTVAETEQGEDQNEKDN